MTNGELFMRMYPDVKVKENRSCMWIYNLDCTGCNHHTMSMEWWNDRIPETALKPDKKPTNRELVLRKLQGVRMIISDGAYSHRKYMVLSKERCEAIHKTAGEAMRYIEQCKGGEQDE